MVKNSILPVGAKWDSLPSM